MNNIEQYLALVLAQIPDAIRLDARQQLMNEIRNRLQKSGADVNDEVAVKQVLESLGSPEVVARRFGAKSRALIRAEYFSAYIAVLKLVAVIVFFVTSSLAVFAAITSETTLLMIVWEYVWALIGNGLQAGAIVTIIFALLDYYNVDLRKTNWQASTLASIPQKKLRISRGESVFTILVSGAFLAFLYFTPVIPWYSSGAENVLEISLINSQTFASVKWLLVGTFGFSFLQESLKIVWGSWTWRRVGINAACVIASMACALGFFLTPDILHPELVRLVETALDANPYTFINAILFFMVLVSLGEIASSIYKVKRYLPQKN